MLHSALPLTVCLPLCHSCCLLLCAVARTGSLAIRACQGVSCAAVVYRWSRTFASSQMCCTHAAGCQKQLQTRLARWCMCQCLTQHVHTLGQ
jgi:hypothetical protein